MASSEIPSAHESGGSENYLSVRMVQNCDIWEFKLDNCILEAFILNKRSATIY